MNSSSQCSDLQRPKRPPVTAGTTSAKEVRTPPVRIKQLVYSATWSSNSCAEQSHKDKSPKNQLLEREAPKDSPTPYESRNRRQPALSVACLTRAPISGWEVGSEKVRVNSSFEADVFRMLSLFSAVVSICRSVMLITWTYLHLADPLLGSTV